MWPTFVAVFSVKWSLARVSRIGAVAWLIAKSGEHDDFSRTQYWLIASRTS